MNLLYSILLCFALQVSSVYDVYSQNPWEYYERATLWQYGDDLNRKNLDFDDSLWPAMWDNEIDSKNNFFWMRTKIIIPEKIKPPEDLGICISLTATYEVFWNGVSIGTNCLEGNDIRNENGKLSTIILLPDSVNILRENVIAIRAYVPENTQINYVYLDIAEFSSLMFTTPLEYLFMSLLLAVHLMLVYYFYRNYKSHKYKWRYFSLMFLVLFIALSILFELFLYIFTVPYQTLFWVNNIEIILGLLVIWSFSLIFSYEFNFPQKTVAFITSAVVILSAFFIFDYYAYFESVALLPALVIVIWAVYKKKEGSFNALFGLFVFLSIILSQYEITLFQLTYLVFPFFISISISKDYILKKKQFQLSKTQSARLESELLRKVIQPHYVMNSLNAVLEWLEEDPKKGVDFIHALSEEFRSFSQISNEKLIYVNTELKMCESHLKIMKYRQDTEYELLTDNVDRDKKIPPAIFHTVIENGITHAPPESGQLKIIIAEENIENGIRYRITTKPSQEVMESGKGDQPPLRKGTTHRKIIDGTGISYIKSRLAESYGPKFKLTSNKYKFGWETIIEIYD